MSVADSLMEFIELRFDEYDLSGVDPEPNEPWSYELDEPDLLLHTLRGDMSQVLKSASQEPADPNKPAKKAARKPARRRKPTFLDD